MIGDSRLLLYYASFKVIFVKKLSQFKVIWSWSVKWEVRFGFEPIYRCVVNRATLQPTCTAPSCDTRNEWKELPATHLRVLIIIIKKFGRDEVDSKRCITSIDYPLRIFSCFRQSKTWRASRKLMDLKIRMQVKQPVQVLRLWIAKGVGSLCLLALIC